MFIAVFGGRHIVGVGRAPTDLAGPAFVGEDNSGRLKKTFSTTCPGAIFCGQEAGTLTYLLRT